MKIKICGMQVIPNLSEVSLLQPDYLGFIFYPLSPRYAGNLPPTVLQNLPQDIEKVGVFVNESIATMQQTATHYHIRTLQLHGHESPATCQALQAQNYQVIKAFHIENQEDISKIAAYVPFINYALLDTKGKHLGGNGITFDWGLLQNYTFDLPFFLSGGISLANITQIYALKHPQLIGIDVNSQFELTAGLKDIEQLKKLFVSKNFIYHK
jgi:phosphoribosylanthranilate isomerase